MTLSDLDLYLFSQGRHERLWEVLGAHPVEGGTDFAVWAPHAQAVFLDGEFTDWDLHGGIELKPQGPSGVWTGYVPGRPQVAALQVPHPRARTGSGSSTPTRWPGTPRCRRPARR